MIKVNHLRKRAEKRLEVSKARKEGYGSDTIPMFNDKGEFNERNWNGGEDVFYSGDATNTYFKNNVVGKLNHFDILYVDTCKADYEGNVHLSLRELTELIPKKYRHKVWCMHLDEGFVREEAEALGFNVVVNEF